MSMLDFPNIPCSQGLFVPNCTLMVCFLKMSISHNVLSLPPLHFLNTLWFVCDIVYVCINLIEFLKKSLQVLRWKSNFYCLDHTLKVHLNSRVLLLQPASSHVWVPQHACFARCSTVVGFFNLQTNLQKQWKSSASKTTNKNHVERIHSLKTAQ